MSDKEKIIGLLAEVCRKHSHCSEDYCKRNRECCKYDYAEHLISNGVTFAKDTDVPSKWIRVEDKMPHAEYGESDNVLAVGGLGIVEMLYFDGGCWCYPTGEPVFYEDPSWRITHWMPLPEPPVMQEVPNGTDHV